ncbi:small-conductance mechanosensitive channel [Roseateles depolymerans]|uniref:Mechanosensitive ion channel family protein n=2 Tax=Roseateles depolymerans TaxID=76731 RepID=A0A0U3MKU2_9BURK|nr:Mechanosensitive ion channel family protein [Roseateles depolymerans]REG13867.1 small-conductance mechanosensitive channel [Roseateles depolymerans]
MRRLMRGLLLSLLLGATALAAAQAPDNAPPDPAQLLEAARKDMDAVRGLQDDTLDDAATLQLRKRALSAQTQAQEAASALEPELQDVQARLAQLGKPADGVKESADVAKQRAELMAAVSRLDSQIKLARLMAVEAEQAAATALENRRSQLGARLGEKVDALVGVQFWRKLARDSGSDLRRLQDFGDEWRTRLSGVSAGQWLALGAAVAVLMLLQFGVQRGVATLTAHRVAPGRLRRSLYAGGVLLTRTLMPGLIGHVAVLVLSLGDNPTARLDRWLQHAEAIVWFGAFVYGLASALLMPRKPSWRLPPIPDTTASRLAWFPTTFALTVVLAWVIARLASALQASDAMLWTISAASSLAFILVLGTALRQAQRKGEPPGDAPADASEADSEGDSGHGRSAQVPSEPPASLPLWLSLLRTALWLVLGAAMLALLIGYVGLGSFVVNQLVWGLIVLSAAYLIAAMVDDVGQWLLKRSQQAAAGHEEGAGGHGAHGARGAAGSGSASGGAGAAASATGDLAAASAASRTRAQAIVLLSGAGRVMVGVFAVVLLLAPFGEGPLELFARAGRIQEGLSVGELSLKPMALLQGLAVLVLGLLAVRLLKQWLATRYMPTTRMDAGMRMSATTLFGYVGVVAVIAASMSAVGVGLERVAWVASALSVGIGFGLQAVVQNFVSGLILLAERPVKVGDWVALSGVEGDIRRINVRATEIQMGDRSTVIVPNSEFITKIVRNVTYGESLGMVQFKLPMPLATDTTRARALILEAFRAHPSVLGSPAPNVQLDGINAEGTNLILNASGFVNSPRAAYSVKSDLLFDVLDRLRRAGLLPGQTPVVEEESPPAPG